MLVHKIDIPFDTNLLGKLGIAAGQLQMYPSHIKHKQRRQFSN